MRKTMLVGGSITLVLTIVTLAWLWAPGAEAARGLWPVKKGELCWLDGEDNLVRAWTEKMGGNHYILHGAVIYEAASVPGPEDVQPFSGNVELMEDLGLAIGQVNLFQVNPTGRIPPPPVGGGTLEGFSGIFWIDVMTLEGTAEGITYDCGREDPDRYDCLMRNNGPVVLTPVPCP